MRKLLPTVLILLGVGILLSVFMPIGLSQLAFAYNTPDVIVDPTAGKIETDVSAVADDTQVNNWFAGQPPLPSTVKPSKITYYTLSIPSVNLNDVTVEINGTDLAKNAIQYPGTAVPGTYGNTVIFGHSTLAQLYKVGNPLSIFNPLLKVKVGDEVDINYDGVAYRYIIRNTAEIKPTDIEVLAQRYDRYELTLITCTPLGTFFHRFVARAELVN